MAEITVKLPKDFEKVDPLLLKFLIQNTIKEDLKEFEKIEKIISKSKITKRTALELGKMINKSLSKKYEKIIK